MREAPVVAGFTKAAAGAFVLVLGVSVAVTSVICAVPTARAADTSADARGPSAAEPQSGESRRDPGAADRLIPLPASRANDPTEAPGPTTSAPAEPAAAGADTAPTAHDAPAASEPSDGKAAARWFADCNRRFDQLARAMATVQESLETCRWERLDARNEVERLSDDLAAEEDEARRLRAAVVDAECANPLVACPGRDDALPEPGDAFDRFMAPAERERLQSDLSVLGYYTGRIDGDIGSRTRSALAAYQESVGLDGNGLIGNDILLRINREALLLMRGLRQYPPAMAGIPVAMPTDIGELIALGTAGLAADAAEDAPQIDIARFWLTEAARRGDARGYHHLARLLRAHGDGPFDREIADILDRTSIQLGLDAEAVRNAPPLGADDPEPADDSAAPSALRQQEGDT